MKPIRSIKHVVAAVAMACVALTQLSAAWTNRSEPAPQAAALAARCIQWGGAAGGVCAVCGDDASLATALGRQGNFVVQCLCSSSETCQAQRAVIRRQGLYGNVSADVLTAGRLPYAENLVNLIVVEGSMSKAVDPQEVWRVLCPLGTAWFQVASGDSAEKLAARLRALGADRVSTVESNGQWVSMRRPWPEAIDQWTHYLHGPDGNPVARDRVVGPPKHYQWVSGPTWQRCHETDSSISTLVTAEGRLFYITDEAPISLVGNHSLPDKWFLVARDAFNGVPLWKVPIRRWGWREWKTSWFNTRPGDIPLNVQKRLVAAGDRVYVTLGYQAPVSALDARTGEIVQTYADTERTNEILYVDGTLVLSQLDGKQARVTAIDARSGKRLWSTSGTYRGSVTDYIKWKEMGGSTEPAELDPALNIACDGQAVAVLDGDGLACLDFRTGQQRWRSPFPLDEADRNAGGMAAQQNLWVGTMIVRDGVVVHASPNQLAGLSADTGKLLWKQPKKYIGHLWYEWKDVFVIDGLVWTWSAELQTAALTGQKKERAVSPKSVNGYDLHTGEMKKSVPLGNLFIANHHHRCYRNKATELYILASRRGSEYVDLVNGHHTINNWVRGTCHVGMMPANGLQYAPPHPCACYIDEKLNGMNVLAPARSEAKAAIEWPSLEKGPAFGRVESRQAAADDWPEFRHDGARSGAAETVVPDRLSLRWRVAAGSRVSCPTVVGPRVYTALIDEHHVACLSADDGKKLWEFATGARVDSQPTYYQGYLLFGSADGWLYCLRASDGQLAWRFRGAAEPRQIGAHDQLESAWPLHGSVLVRDDLAYFTAGRSSHVDGGIRFCAVEVATGKLAHETRLEGPDFAAEDVEQNCGLAMGNLSDILLSDGAHVYLRNAAFDAELKPARGRPELLVRGGLLDDSYFKRVPWTFANDHARLLVHDKQSVYYVRMFDSLRGLDPSVYFTPGDKGYLLFAKNGQGKANAWSGRVPVRIRAMALAKGNLFVAGPPDVVDPKDPLGAFENRKGGLLYVVDAAGGQRKQEVALPSPPVFNGAAVAGGRLYLAAEDGSIACFAGEADKASPAR